MIWEGPDFYKPHFTMATESDTHRDILIHFSIFRDFCICKGFSLANKVASWVSFVQKANYSLRLNCQKFLYHRALLKLVIQVPIRYEERLWQAHLCWVGRKPQARRNLPSTGTKAEPKVQITFERSSLLCALCLLSPTQGT